MHTRQQILAAFAALMPIPKFVERVYTLRKDQGDCVLIDWQNEQVLTSYMGKKQDRELDVNLTVASKSDKDVAARLDGYAEQIEPLIPYDLGISVLSCQLINVIQDISAEGERPIGYLTMTYRVKYRTNYSDPTAIV